MIVAGTAKVPEKKPPPPLQTPGIVAVARSAPVGRLPEALRNDTVMFGIVTAEQLRLKRFSSTRATGPVTAAVKVCPNHVVVLKLAPWVPSVRFFWSRTSGCARTALPGLTVRSTLLGTPVWSSACELSTRQALVGALAREKFCVVVLPSVTTRLVTEAETNPGALAVALG